MIYIVTPNYRTGRLYADARGWRDTDVKFFMPPMPLRGFGPDARFVFLTDGWDESLHRHWQWMDESKAALGRLGADVTYDSLDRVTGVPFRPSREETR